MTAFLPKTISQVILAARHRAFWQCLAEEKKSQAGLSFAELEELAKKDTKKTRKPRSKKAKPASPFTLVEIGEK